MISETFNQHFVSVGEKLAGEISAPVNDTSFYLSKNKVSNANFKFTKIQPSQVYRLLSGLKNGKVSGIDKIPNRIFKQSKDIITPALTEMFNIFIQFNIFPDDPISIISAIGRIFEKLIYNQLIEFLQRNEVLGNHQWGFRSLHSTALALIDCSNNWLINIDKRERIFL